MHPDLPRYPPPEISSKCSEVQVKTLRPLRDRRLIQPIGIRYRRNSYLDPFLKKITSAVCSKIATSSKRLLFFT